MGGRDTTASIDFSARLSHADLAFGSRRSGQRLDQVNCARVCAGETLLVSAVAWQSQRTRFRKGRAKGCHLIILVLDGLPALPLALARALRTTGSVQISRSLVLLHGIRLRVLSLDPHRHVLSRQMLPSDSRTRSQDHGGASHQKVLSIGTGGSCRDDHARDMGRRRRDSGGTIEGARGDGLPLKMPLPPPSLPPCFACPARHQLDHRLGKKRLTERSITSPILSWLHARPTQFDISSSSFSPQGHTGSVMGLATSTAAEGFMCSVSKDFKARLWDVEAGACVSGAPSTP